MGLPDVDVAVVGAGPAGIAAARGLLAQGLRVMVIDPGLPPVARIESLPPNGTALAESLGLGPALARAGMGRAVRTRLFWRETPETREFGSDGPLLLDRVLLHRALRDLLPPDRILAAKVGRVQDLGDRVLLQHGARTLSAGFVIDARGRAGLRAPRGAGGSQVALSFSGNSKRVAEQCEMLLQALPGGWLWACQLPDSAMSGAVFLPATDLSGLDERGRATRLAYHLTGSDLGLPERLATGPVVPAMLRVADDPFASSLVLRVGDSALARDPVASHGLMHALRSGAQAAAAIATILDPAGQADAARAFVRDRHRATAEAARAATARSHAEQAQHRTPFWVTAALPPMQDARPWPTLSRPLALAPLRRAAELQGGRVRWSGAIWCPRSGQAVSRFGPVSAARVAGLLGPPAAITVLSARLEQALDPALAQAILRQLLDEDALRECAAPPLDQVMTADLSKV